MKIRVKKMFFVLAGSVILGGIFFPIAPVSAGSNKVQLSQKILPVTFVYVGKNQKVVDVWSNVSKNDDLYALKFFDASKKKEIGASDDLIANYIKQKYDQKYGEQKKMTLSETVYFEKENGVITQINTVI